MRLLYSSKTLVLTIGLLLVVAFGKGANYFTRQTGDWNSNTTWSLTSGGVAVGLGIYPVAGDNVTFGASDNVTVTAPAACATITFIRNSESSLNINLGIKLTVTGVISIDGSKGGTSTNIIAVGDGYLEAGSIAFLSTSGSKGHQITISTGTVTVMGNVSGGAKDCTISFSGAGLLKLGGSIFSSTYGTLTTFAGSTVEYNAAGAQTVGNFSYSNLTLSGSGAKSIVTGTSIANNLSISGGTATASMGINITVNSLTLGGFNKNSGTWGSTSSSATYKDNTYFNLNGIVTVTIDNRQTPSITILTASQSICYGTATVVLSGSVSAPGPVYPANGETASVTINGVTQNTTISGNVGAFSINFNTSTIPSSGTSYPIIYVYAGSSNGNLNAAANNTGTALTVNPSNTIALTSTAGTDAQTRCINTAITSITYSTTGATGATFAGLPTGVTGAWAANVVTISGTPTVSGPFSYTITLTGGCSTITKTGTITVTPNNTITLSSAANTDAQTRCINTPITNITYTTTGATGATFAGLPAGVTGAWAANVVTISGTSTASGAFTFTITLTGGCSTITKTGTITVTLLPIATFSYSGSPYCQNAVNPSPTFSGGGVAGTFSSTAGLIFVSTASGQVNLSSSTAGTYTVTNTITAAGGCGIVTATSLITIKALPVATFSYAGTASPTFSGGGVAGTFSSTSGLNFVSTSTGEVNLASSTAGTYTVTNTIIASGGCSIVTASNTITITASLSVAFIWVGTQSTDWNVQNNWSTGVVPVSTSDVVIPDISTPPNFDPVLPSAPAVTVNTITIQPGGILGGGTKLTTLSVIHDFSLSGTAVATLAGTTTVGGYLTIAAGSKLSVGPTSNLTVSGSIYNADLAGLVLQSDATGTASLIHSNDGVAATVQRYIGGISEDWHFLSSPVVAQGFDDTWLPNGSYANGTGYDLYLWNEPTKCWIYKLNTDPTLLVNWSILHPTTYFVSGRGYLYSVLALNPTKTFTGILNNGNQSYMLTAECTDATYKGFNLVGNPYPSAIDWKASGWTRDKLEIVETGNFMWIWNPDPAIASYGVYNSADLDNLGTNSVTRYIASMQGFFVKASSSGNLSMDNSVRIHDATGTWKSKEQEIGNVGKVSLIVKSDTGIGSDEIQLRFGYSDTGNGAMKMFSRVASSPNLYMASKGNELSVMYLTNTKENPAVPVKLAPGVNGNYTIITNFDQSNFETVMLEDRQMHSIQNMKIAKTYSFKASKTDDVNRFVLYFGPVNSPTGYDLPARIFNDGTHLVVDLTLVSKETNVLVYDIMGRILLKQKLQGGILHNLNINIQTQMLAVYLQNPDGSLSRKLIWVR